MLTLFNTSEVKSKRIWQQMMRSCKANRTGTNAHAHFTHTCARTHAHTLSHKITDTSWVKDDSFLFKRAW